MYRLAPVPNSFRDNLSFGYGQIKKSGRPFEVGASCCAGKVCTALLEISSKSFFYKGNGLLFYRTVNESFEACKAKKESRGE